MTHEHSFAGIRADSILGYLKALGLLRLIAQQGDASARGSWEGPTFVLHTAFKRHEIEEFFLDRYSPTPVFNPWNNGAGFDEKSAKVAAGTTLDAVAETTGKRWRAARTVLGIAREIVATVRAGDGDKAEILRSARARYPDDGLVWLDAAVVVGRVEPDFPRLLGTGGNDGRLDFSINFLQRALDVVGPRPLGDAPALLADALDATGHGRLLSGAAIGQYAPASAGGVNATAGFAAESLVNPWDYVLLIEGAVAFSGSVGKRFAAAPRSVFPFTFATVVGGYASASTTEETRGELWLPRWRGTATFGSVRNMLRLGRVDVENAQRDERPSARAATTSIEAAQGAIAQGVGAGIDGFERIVIAQRNGLAFSATRVGYVDTRSTDPAAAELSRESSRWINRVRRAAEQLGAAAREALRAHDEAIFAFTTRPGKAALQAWLAALGSLDRAVALRPPDGLTPLYISEAAGRRIAGGLDDGSDEHALAAAWASVGSASPMTSMRVAFGHVALGGQAKYLGRADERPLIDFMANLCAQRFRKARELGDRAWIAGHERSGVSLGAVEALLTADSRFVRRVASLLKGYVLLPPIEVAARGDADDNSRLPVALAVAKMLFDGTTSGVDTHAFELDPDVPNLLAARRSSAALDRIQRDAAIAAAAVADEHVRIVPRTIRYAAINEPRVAAAVLLLPLHRSARVATRNQANALFIRKDDDDRNS